jgi:Homeodomain-like domain-containing protein
MPYPETAWERAMTVQEVLLKALAGELHWYRAAEILGWSPRTVRRWRERYEAFGYSGLIDKRLLCPSSTMRAAAAGRAGLAAVPRAVPGIQCAALS